VGKYLRALTKMMAAFKFYAACSSSLQGTCLQGQLTPNDLHYLWAKTLSGGSFLPSQPKCPVGTQSDGKLVTGMKVDLWPGQKELTMIWVPYA